MDNDLFDVFDRSNGNGNGNGIRNEGLVNRGDRQVEESPDVPENGSNSKRHPTHNGSEPFQKRKKIASGVRLDKPDPVVTDTFETEASREVVASAGLQAATPTDGASMVLSHQVRHQVALPPDYKYVPISEHRRPETPARTYPFKLDPFQEVSIASIERQESVLVSAHTSAGKTVVAEYAIAQSLKDKQRVIYTSPIKALSNQKYRELAADFGDVGLMTGDVTINPSASCLVMTTEILRSMLYRGSEIMREVAWVIFDEIHYMRDKERGVVWEETIILLPDKVRYVFLSATIPNAMQFAEWICKIHVQPCHVVYTDLRPTPLQHYLFPAGGEGIHLVVDEKGVFREENFQRSMGTILDKMGDDPYSIGDKKDMKKGKSYKGGAPKNEKSDIVKIVKMIMVKNYYPVIVFSFAKRECENLALQMSKLDMNDESEHELVSKIFENAISSLSEEDRHLPQIDHILPLLRNGIGIHHSGLLPILKEVIEIMFQEGLIKVLFATETFAIGLNMPAKTVVFTGCRKWDGRETRWLSSGEYVQASGRAGRRGIDDRGIVILMIDEQMEPPIAKGMLLGQADRLDSAFQLGYNMLLNLMRVEEISPEFMLERCFYRFQNTAEVPTLDAELRSLEQEYESTVVDDESTTTSYCELREQIDTYRVQMRDITNHPRHCLMFIQPGRLVRVKYRDIDFGWGVVVSYSKRAAPKDPKVNVKAQDNYILDVCLRLDAGAVLNPIRTKSELPPGVRPPPPGESGKMEVVPVLLSCLDGIGHVRIFLPKDIRSPDERKVVGKQIDEVKRRFPDGIPLLDPIENLKITDESFLNLLRKIEVVESRLFANPLTDSDRLPELYEQCKNKLSIKSKMNDARIKLNAAQSIIQLDELKCRKRVLRRLGFTTQENVIETKGRVACEISTGDELLITELIFNGVFATLSSEQCAALLSCIIFEERSSDDAKLRPELTEPLQVLQETARRIAKVSNECKLEVIENDYVDSFRPQLMEVVYMWATGATFAQIWYIIQFRTKLTLVK